MKYKIIYENINETIGGTTSKNRRVRVGPIFRHFTIPRLYFNSNTGIKSAQINREIMSDLRYLVNIIRNIRETFLGNGIVLDPANIDLSFQDDFYLRHGASWIRMTCARSPVKWTC